MFKQCIKFVVFLTFILGVAAQAQETQVVSVSGKSNGNFGFLAGIGAPGEDDSTRNLVQGIALIVGQKVEITAVGEIQLFPGMLTGPDGATFLPRRPDPNVFPPLEEAFFDAGGNPTTLDDPVPVLGALMGAFVPRGVVESAGFIPRNNDLIPIPGLDTVPGSISSDSLFLIGAGPFVFTAPISGTLFLGVNDANVANNDLAFTVTLIAEDILPVEIDIKPGSEPNSINLKSKGNIPVAVHYTESLDATQINWETVRFGPNGATEAHGRSHIEDIDDDGDADLVLHFETLQTGIQCGDTEVALSGETFSGQAIIGTDAIVIVKCH